MEGTQVVAQNARMSSATNSESPLSARFSGSGLQAARIIKAFEQRKLSRLWNEILLAHVFADFLLIGKSSVSREDFTTAYLSSLWLNCRVERGMVLQKPELKIDVSDIDRFEGLLNDLGIPNNAFYESTSTLRNWKIGSALRQSIGDAFRIGQMVHPIPANRSLSAKKSLLHNSLQQAKISWRSSLRVQGNVMVECGRRADDTMLRKLRGKWRLIHYAYSLYILRQSSEVWWRRRNIADSNLVVYLNKAATVFMWCEQNEVGSGLDCETLKAAAAIYQILDE